MRCPILRYHPAIVAQKAATVQVLSDGRLRLGLGAGEAAVGVRHEMLAEAFEVIGALFDGNGVNHRGKHFDVESAQLFDRHDTRVPIGLAVSGERSCTLAGRHADLMVAVEPSPSWARCSTRPAARASLVSGSGPLLRRRPRRRRRARTSSFAGSAWAGR